MSFQLFAICAINVWCFDDWNPNLQNIKPLQCFTATAVAVGVAFINDFASTLDQIDKSDKQIKLSVCTLFFRLLCLSASLWLVRSEPRMYGDVVSPQYPQPYGPNLLQQWVLTVPEGFQIRLTFTHLDIEASPGCLYDSLTVRAATTRTCYHNIFEQEHWHNTFE